MKKIIAAFGYSLAGLFSAMVHERAFKQELLLTVVLVPCALLMEVSVIEKVLLLSSLMLILIVELLNTGIEAVVDRISEERHELSKKAKDVGSAAVLLAFVNAAGIWGIVVYSTQM